MPVHSTHLPVSYDRNVARAPCSRSWSRQEPSVRHPLGRWARGSRSPERNQIPGCKQTGPRETMVRKGGSVLGRSFSGIERFRPSDDKFY